MGKELEIILENATLEDYKEILGGKDIPKFGQSVEVEGFGTVTNCTPMRNRCMGDTVAVFILGVASSMAANWLYDKLIQLNQNKETKIYLKINSKYIKITYERIEEAFKESDKDE